MRLTRTRRPAGGEAALWGFPGGTSGEQSTRQCRRHGFDPWSWKTPHAAEQRSQCAPAIEPPLYRLRAPTTEPSAAAPEALVPGARALKGEAATTRSLSTTVVSSPHLLQLENEPMNEVAQSCPTLCNPTDCSLPGSSIRGIFLARVLAWVSPCKP